MVVRDVENKWNQGNCWILIRVPVKKTWWWCFLLFLRGIFHEERQEEKRIKATKKVERIGNKCDQITWEEKNLLALDTIINFVPKLKMKRETVYYLKRKQNTTIEYLYRNKNGKNICGEEKGKNNIYVTKRSKSKREKRPKNSRGQKKCLSKKKKSLIQKIKHLETIERGPRFRAIYRRRFCHIAN